MNGGREGLGGAELVEDGGPVFAGAAAAAGDDDAVAPDADVGGLRADVESPLRALLGLGEEPVVAFVPGVRVQRGSVLVEGDVDERDVVLVVVVEGVQRARLAAAGRSPGGEEVEEDGAASGGRFEGGR